MEPIVVETKDRNIFSESDEEIPDLEVVPKDDLVDMTRLSQSAPAVPKGFRRVEIEMAESEDDEDPFDQEEINMDDLPDLEMSQGDTLLVANQDSSKTSEEPVTSKKVDFFRKSKKVDFSENPKK